MSLFSKSSPRVIPGFGLTMGVTLTLLSLVVLLPLAALVAKTTTGRSGPVNMKSGNLRFPVEVQ